MPDKILICQNCQKPFVYSEYEQRLDEKSARPEPVYDNICASIKESEAKHPPKPKKSPVIHEG